MTKIDELIAELCPNGVEWKELGEVCELRNGYTPAKSKPKFWENGTIPWFRLEDIRKNGRILSNAIQYVTEEAVKKEVFPANSLIVSTTATIGEVALITVPFLCNQQITAMTPSGEYENLLDIKFLFYYMQILSVEMKKGINEGSFPIISLSKMKTFKIPVPPKKIQEEIVQILDKFTEYVTELTAELTFRKQQYSYHRDKLLSFENEVYEVEWKTLKDVAKLKNGRDWKKLSSGDVPVYGSGGEMGEFVSEYTYDKPTVLIPRKGSISNLFYLEAPFWNVDTVYYTEIDESQIIPRYFYHYLTTVDLESMATNPTRPSLTQAILDKIMLPIPSLAIQSRIVQVLDNFDTICNDLKIGLPKEIEQRQKQYEYFRDKLLTFAAEGVYTDSTAQHSTAQHSTAQHSTAQHSTAQHSTAQHSTAQHSTDKT
ncbi:restriction endonuclease subunit S [Aerococcaceae bacterium zg-ZUI334]|uniref:restriction endonuclease subunit S n=1 Tax=Aerococcaceae bacterium zg-252 TaxID=2796928 RepID=UPI001B9A2419|nr:restriction endonuclease subunit S [Aerococcaceae bacterium zg-ZUI334]